MIYTIEIRNKVLVDRTEQFEIDAKSIEEAKEFYSQGAWIDECIHDEAVQESEITGVWDENGNQVYAII